jgi:hypothetical protein
MSKEITDFLAWMAKRKIYSVIPFFILQNGRDGSIPHWTDGKKLFNADELFKLYTNETKKNTLTPSVMNPLKKKI